MLGRIWSAAHRRLDSIGHARRLGVTVGERCRLLDVTFSTEPWLVTIGNHVSATKTHFETHDGGVWVFRDEEPEIDVIKPITVEDNVYIGYGTTILPGVTIGNGAVVGAHSVVTRDVPPDTVVAGVPARVIKSVDEYKAQAIATGDKTKLLDAATKRSYYEKKYLSKS